MSFSVAFKGAQHTLELPPQGNLAELAALLAERCGVAPETIKLLGGKAGMVRPAEHPERSLQEAGEAAWCSWLQFSSLCDVCLFLPPAPPGLAN